MNLKEKIPFLGGNGAKISDKQDRVRLLGKLEESDKFEFGNFNELIKTSIQNMESKREDESVILDEEFKQDINEEELLRRHISYRIKVGEEESGSPNEDNIVEGKRFKVILRKQPSKAIEINGPYELSSPFKDSLKTRLKNCLGKRLPFGEY